MNSNDCQSLSVENKLSEQFAEFIDLTDKNLEEIIVPGFGRIQGGSSCSSSPCSPSSPSSPSSCSSCRNRSCSSCSCSSCRNRSCSSYDDYGDDQ